MGLIDRLRGLFGRRRAWHEKPKIAAVRELVDIRNELRRQNLHDTEDGPLTDNLPPVAGDAPQRLYRTTDGTYNDLKYPRMGALETRFGRNFALKNTLPDAKNVLNPNPRVVSRELMTRTEFQPASILNLLAAAWIQFEVHDWFSHGKTDPASGVIEVPLDAGDPWPQRPMQIPRTEPDPRPSPAPGKPPTFANHVTHWWDGSQIYGSKKTIAAKVRAWQDGKLRIGEDRILLFDDFTGVDLTAITDNWWTGLSMLHTLFTLEHNAIAAELKNKHPQWDDEKLFQTARLINAALMAKIHTVEWTPCILPHETVQLAMRTNWYGLVRQGLQNIIPRLEDNELLGGIIGSKQDHHAAPYSLTEEFVAVYRMHPLMPDEFDFVSIDDGRKIGHFELPEIGGKNARKISETVRMQDLFYSFGLMHPGAMRLHNYPRHLQNLRKDDGTIFDMAAVDILRDRERGVPRYNKFREMLRMDRVKSFRDLTDDAASAAQIERVYGGDIEMVDLMTGLFAEPLPKGFGFSETAFRIFVLMASRRLKSDRFFTDDYKESIYTETGLKWIEKNGMASVLTRHYPELAPALEGVWNPFAPWKRVK